MHHKLILIILDGCRPDGLAQAHTPHIDALWRGGAYTWSAQSVMPCISLPAHMSMFRGVSPARHGVTDNTFVPAAARFPSVIDLASRAGLHAAMFYDWEELRDLAEPGALRLSYYRAYRPGEPPGAVTADAAAAYLGTEQPDLCVLYMGAIDEVGHAAGWMSPPYLEAIAQADDAVGRVLASCEAAGVREQCVTLLLADHGGEGHDHGADTPANMRIPWVLNGPGVRQGHYIQTPVVLYDTAATVAHVLGLPLPGVGDPMDHSDSAGRWEGRPVYEAFV